MTVNPLKIKSGRQARRALLDSRLDEALHGPSKTSLRALLEEAAANTAALACPGEKAAKA